MAVGFILNRYLRWSHDFFRLLSGFIVKVALPLYFFIKISSINPREIADSILFPITALLIIPLVLISAWLLFRSMKLSPEESRVGTVMSGFGNSAYFPLMLIEILPATLPLTAEAFGTRIPTLYVGAYILIQIPLLWSVGNLLVSGRGARLRARGLISPPLIGIIAGVFTVVTGLQKVIIMEHLPFLAIYNAMDRLGQVTFPLILICLGAMIARIRFNEIDIKHLFKISLTVAAFRFLLMPMLFWGSYFLFLKNMKLMPAQLWVLFLETHVPPPTDLSVMASQARNAENLVSFTILITYILFLLLLPLYMVFFLGLPGIL